MHRTKKTRKEKEKEKEKEKDNKKRGQTRLTYHEQRRPGHKVTKS
jgi:hypothetical protein